MKKSYSCLLLIICLTIPNALVAANAIVPTATPNSSSTTNIQGLRMWAGPEGTRVVLDLDQYADYNVFTLEQPQRVVVDLKNARLHQGLAKVNFEDSLLENIRSSKRGLGDLRVVLDIDSKLKGKIKQKNFVLNPTQRYQYRLVIDLEAVSDTNVLTQPIAFDKNEPRAVVIAIDAGHGGEDPGAVGAKGTREKDVVLAISRKLEKLVRQEWGMLPVMVREGDYYVGLRDRIRKARDKQADLFVSIHADAFKNRTANGASIYVLSPGGASSEAARWLAASENSSDLIGGVSLDDKDDLLASVLLDLSQNATIAASMEVGEKVLSALESMAQVRLHKDEVEQAGFVVLKSPDVPSILVETGFISNRSEERKLQNSHYQDKLARAILKGIRRYFRDNPPPNTLLAKRQEEQRKLAQAESSIVASSTQGGRQQKHRIVSGDTLSSIARRYQVSPQVLRHANGLEGDSIQVGQVLIIP